jgi:hypothetical protein
MFERFYSIYCSFERFFEENWNIVRNFEKLRKEKISRRRKNLNLLERYFKVNRVNQQNSLKIKLGLS